MKKMLLWPVMMFASLLFFSPQLASAFEIRTSDNVSVNQDERIEGNLYAAGQNVVIAGTVTGDVICAGQSVKITGNVEGDVLCAGQSVFVHGTVGGDVRAAGSFVDLDAQVARSVNAFGATINLGEQARVGWDMLVGGAAVNIQGNVGRSLHGGGASFLIGGDIADDVKLVVDQNTDKRQQGGLTITKNANIGGKLEYTSPRDAAIEDGAQIAGEVKRLAPPAREGRDRDRGYDFPLGWILFCFISTLIIGWIIIKLLGTRLEGILARFSEKAEISIGVGLLIMILLPIVFVILLITFFGIPLAFILLAAAFVAAMAGKIFAVMVIGRFLLSKITESKKDSYGWMLLAGSLFVSLLFAIPILGTLTCFITIWWGLGGLWLYFRS